MACQISTVQQNAHLPKSADSGKLGIYISKPKYPQYAVTAKRLESFKKWPTYLGIKPEHLVEAGLVYTGVADAVRCYHCGGGLRNWEPGDNPWREHAKWYKDCPHILLVKGQSFVDNVLNGGPIDQDCSQHTKESPQEKIEDLLETAAALSCIQMGYKRDYVEKAVKSYVNNKGHSNFKGVDIAELCEEFGELDLMKKENASGNDTDYVLQAIARYNSVESDTEDENIDELLEENQRLKDDAACKICLEDRADVIFLPCGHIPSCAQCASALTKCPLCRNPVEGYVKALFA